MQRQKVFEEFFIDLISGLKAAYLAEGYEDIICRLTKELSILFELFAALERWPLLNSKSNFTKVLLLLYCFFKLKLFNFIASIKLFF